jgi:hypothetical protein
MLEGLHMWFQTLEELGINVRCIGFSVANGNTFFTIFLQTNYDLLYNMSLDFAT